MTLQVIGAGFGRTGTDSMRAALDMLGFGPCHHMFELKDGSEQQRLWRAMTASDAPPDWGSLLGGYRACVDWPTAAWWPELVEAFPQAKVVLTWRSPESWWESFSKTILPVLVRLRDSDPDAAGYRAVALRSLGGRFEDRAHCLAAYEANAAAVKAAVPAERLLVHGLGDGWGPLCAFLGVPVPDAPYPRSNDAAAFQARVASQTPAER
ncbi:sulfotransferase family protein [Albimonas sp. CAU 1670]|uniref:sulfotransferase family protein n=1 Tax=Albimonas sp. CAU 1670 TaxID=3032599 RepID=UPI0023DBF7A0|nr:sulfotransferase family protein [Albimonas sp. CAU 1670]MDF2232838.1 sulfotransferase family protein [Albimonas sp. CAU 1670]